MAKTLAGTPATGRNTGWPGRRLSVLLGVWVVGSCSGDQPASPPDPVASIPGSVTVSPATVTLAALGETAQLTAEVRDQNGNSMAAATVTWSSSTPAAVTVDQNGLVTAVAAGTATITARAGTAAGSAVVTVQQAPATISLAPDTLTLEGIGDTASIAPRVADANGHAIADARVAWTSGDNTVAAVDATGLVTAVSAGTTEVTATAGGVAASASVIVEFQAVAILLEPSELSFTALGDTLTMTATAVDRAGRAGDASIQWMSGDTTVARVDSGGLVTAAGNGTTSISATAGSVSASATVAVEQVPVTLTVLPGSLTFVGVGDTATVMAAVADANGHEVAGATAEWASRNASVATVDPTGLVTAIRPGSTEVTATVGSLAAAAGVKVLSISSDRDVLEHLYRTTGGDGWRDNTNWLTNAPLSEWGGVETDHNGRVVHLALRDNGLTGRIPRSLGLLDELFILDLGSNSLSGRIPPEIGELQVLRDLNLNANELSGPLPPEMGNMAGLRYLTISGNNLAGTVPETFAQLILTNFYLDATYVCLPPGLETWYESIGDKTVDPLPCIPATPDREALVALYNAMGGPVWNGNQNWLTDAPINTWYGVTTDEEGHVTELYLSDNNLSGPLPPEIGDLPRVETLWLHGNALTGPIPPEIGRLAKVRNLSLADNRFEGPIPAEIGGLASVDSLYLSMNNLSGPIPPEIGDLDSLLLLALYENQLTGPLPASLGNLKRLEELALPDNRIDGPLPRELGDMTSLVFFSLSRNQVSGSLPPELGKLKALEHFSVNDNRMVGPIPPKLA